MKYPRMTAINAAARMTLSSMFLVLHSMFRIRIPKNYDMRSMGNYLGQQNWKIMQYNRR